MTKRKISKEYNNIYRGKFKDVIKFFNENFPGETFDSAFMNIKRLRIGQDIFSYDTLYRLYRSIDGKYVLFERKYTP